jgi:uncharacterized protein YukE
LFADPGVVTGDFHSLTALAARLRVEAQRTRDVTRRVGQAREVHWQSVAARAFRAKVEHLMSGLGRVADELDEAAGALERHGVAVQDARDAIAQATVVGDGLAAVARSGIAAATPAGSAAGTAALAARAVAGLAR